ncbi:OB-fold protein [Pseudomonas sp. MPB23]|uniref:OB-fold protein n=1 Tax=Pseudomonas sp. MPB23 TaxID=3388490 RepID=UPI00398506B2
MSDVNVPAKRNVGFLLGIGILFFPIIFAWFLLRKGHSVLSRVVGFGWLILCILVIVAAPPAPPSAGSRSVATATPAAASAPAEPLKTYTSTQVAKSYDDNTVAADALFKGKRVKVTGRITDINTDFRGNPYLVLAGSNQFLGPQFKFDKSSISVMATLKKGVTVSVICTGAGDVIKTPMFEDCEMSK